MADDELPKLFSDEEFKVQRELQERRDLEERRELPDRRTEERRREPTQLGRKPSDGRPESTLEQKFPHLAKKLTALWLSEPCAVLLSSLMISDRPDRQGFPYDVLEDLIMLTEINTMLMPKPGLGQTAKSLAPTQTAKSPGPGQTAKSPNAWGDGARREHD